MRVDPNFSITRTFPLRSSWLWQMLTVVSYQQRLEPTVRRVTLNVFKNSIFGKLLESNKLNIPDPTVLPSDAEGLSMPFVPVGDEAFASSEHVLRPYRNKKVTFLKRIYNYRVSRARRIGECTFGILANKWRIFHRLIDVKPDFCVNIVKACCVLHDYVRKIMVFSWTTLCMNVPWKVQSLSEKKGQSQRYCCERVFSKVSHCSTRVSSLAVQ